MGRKRPVRLPTQPEALAPRNDQEATVRQPVNAEGKAERRADGDLAFTGKIGRNYFLSAPIRQP